MVSRESAAGFPDGPGSASIGISLHIGLIGFMIPAWCIPQQSFVIDIVKKLPLRLVKTRKRYYLISWSIFLNSVRPGMGTGEDSSVSNYGIFNCSNHWFSGRDTARGNKSGVLPDVWCLSSMSGYNHGHQCNVVALISAIDKILHLFSNPADDI